MPFRIHAFSIDVHRRLREWSVVELKPDGRQCIVDARSACDHRGNGHHVEGDGAIAYYHPANQSLRSETCSRLLVRCFCFVAVE
jgi:hypothetical protein